MSITLSLKPTTYLLIAKESNEFTLASFFTSAASLCTSSKVSIFTLLFSTCKASNALILPSPSTSPYTTIVYSVPSVVVNLSPVPTKVSNEEIVVPLIVSTFPLNISLSTTSFTVNTSSLFTNTNGTTVFPSTKFLYTATGFVV